MALFIQSCESEQPECYQPTVVTSNISFVRKRVDTFPIVDSSTGIPRDSLAISYPDSFMIAPRAALLNDSLNLTINTSGRTSVIATILNPDVNQVSYSLQYDTNVALLDTVQIFYRSSLKFISNSCGYTYFFNIDSVKSTKHVADSIFIFKPAVTNDASVRHIGLYFF